MAVGVALSWIFALFGLLVRDSESAGIGGLLAVILLIFTSSTFPVDTFPSWIEAFAQVNPITVTVDALRVLCLGGPATTHVFASNGSDRRPARHRHARRGHTLAARHHFGMVHREGRVGVAIAVLQRGVS